MSAKIPCPGCDVWIKDFVLKENRGRAQLRRASLVAQSVKNPPALWEIQSSPRVGKIPWRREWQPTPVFLPGEFHGQRSLAGYSPWGHKESHTTEQLTLSLFHSSGQ